MNENDAEYVHEVAHARREKDAFLRQSPHSPLPHERRHDFGGLPYYDVDPAYRFTIPALRPLPEGTDRALVMQTSDGRERDAERAGFLDFTVDGRPQSLMAYRFEGDEPDALFIPLRDATSGSETYGAGRYLDAGLEDDGSVVLDFNLAYHPYCAYNEAYSCPLPPPENRLAVPIRAGERL